MNSNDSKTANEQNESLNWESRLEKMRQTRQINAPYKHAPLVTESKEIARPAARNSGDLDAAAREKVLKEYLHKWQQEHNTAVEPFEEAETDTMVLLQDNWLSAQNALQMQASEKHIESKRQIWLNPKRQTVEFPEPQNSEENESENAKTDAVSDGIEAQNSAEIENDPKITVNINVLNPQVIGRREVFCVSEKELTERLIKRMRPHIADAVNGMIRVAVQKQMALFTYQLQQTLSEQAPQLVDDLLEHNVTKILSDLKYEMKYKR